MKLGDLLCPERYALEILNGIEDVHGNLPEDGNDVEEALNMAKNALEKQIPKSVEKTYKTSYMWLGGYCPECDCGVTSRWEYCQKCGQKLNWGD